MPSRGSRLLLLLLLAAIASPLHAELREGRASGSSTVRITIPTVAGVSIPHQVDARIDPDATVARTATFTNAPSGSVTLVRFATRPRLILAAAAPPRARVVERSGWLLREHRLPSIPVAASGNSTPRVVVEVWQF